MFSVITGLNGIGKSTVLKYIQKNVNDLMKEFFDGKQENLADLNSNTNNRKIRFSTNRAVEILLVADNKVTNSNFQIPSYQSVESTILDNQIPITIFTDTVKLLEILKNELNNLSTFFEEKEFKYTRIEFEVDSFVII